MKSLLMISALLAVAVFGPTATGCDSRNDNSAAIEQAEDVRENPAIDDDNAQEELAEDLAEDARATPDSADGDD